MTREQMEWLKDQSGQPISYTRPLLWSLLTIPAIVWGIPVLCWVIQIGGGLLS